MRYLASRVGLAILFCFVLADSGFAHVGLRVNEAGVRLQVRSDGTFVDLPVENRLARPFPGMCCLNWWTHAVLFRLMPTKMHRYLPV